MDSQTVLYILGAAFAVFVLRGIMKGGIGLAIGVLIMGLSLGLSVYSTPQVSGMLLKAAPLEEIITSKCESFIVKNMQEETRKKVNEVLGVDVENACGEKGIDYEALGITREELLKVMNDLGLSREEEVREIMGIDLPEPVRKLMMENNNAVIYEEFGVSDFAGYLGAFLSRIIANTVAFLLVFVLSNVILRLVLGIFIEKPVRRHLGGANRLLGGVLGGAECVVLIWIIFVGVIMIGGTTFGKEVSTVLKQVPLLAFLWEKNPFLKVIWKII